MRGYDDLFRPGMPLMIQKACKLIGIREVTGPASNPVILNWWEELRKAGYGRDYGDFYRDDSIPWCGLWMRWVAYLAGKPGPRLFLAALPWQTFGRARQGAACIGDVQVFERPGGGHVGLYVGHDATHFHVLGGNQGDAVSIVRIPRARLVAVRSPLYKTAPATAVPVLRNPEGAPLSQGEA